MLDRLKYIFIVFCFLSAGNLQAQQKPVPDIEAIFKNPPASAKPWVFWYWMYAAVSKQGITADLEAMKQVGIGGAYLMPIKDTISPPHFQPTARQLSPEWWEMVRFAMQEAKRLDLQLAMHVSDGFALAGGPWITPALSMQKLVWTKSYVKGAQTINLSLPKPETIEGFYKDIAVFAYPANNENAFRAQPMIPNVTTSNGTRADFLAIENSKESFRSDTTCWLQYEYPAAFDLHSIRIHTGGNNYQSHRLIVQASDDGINFRTITRLEPPRHGWQDTDEDVTHAIAPTTSRFFRFIYNKEGTEPGSEDLDAAKWRPGFRVMGIYLSDEPVINQYEGKNGSIWRVSLNTSKQQIPDTDAVPLKKIINISARMDKNGQLRWTAPAGNWVILRVGHTSTGHTNATGGAGKGLECDKFNPAAVTMQFDNWFAKAFEKTDPSLAKEVLKIFHVDSWECGSQNWSDNFKNEFQKRRGYDLMPYLPAMAGVPVENAAVSEKFLHDVRETIAGLINDNFYKTLTRLAHEKGCSFSAEAIAPTMQSDGLLHYKQTDIPMGEFWLNSPTHDKPNDMLDAISGAHIYGKNIVQAEAFTSVRMNWAEYPGMLKAIGDRNFALGINKMVLHVYAHNPWLDRKPGMTLDGVGLYFQRDQTWFKQSKIWIDYLTRCQAMLQLGKPVADIAVFTGEEVPRRAVLPDRLVNMLPGIFGTKKIEEEKKRLANTGQPLRTIPDGVSHSANMADPEDWIDPLNGYAYDSFNPDALQLATVKNGRINLPGGASYAMLVIPSYQKLQPNKGLMSVAVAKKIAQLVRDGATVLLDSNYRYGIGLKDKDDSVRRIIKQLFTGKQKGRVVQLPYVDSSFSRLNIHKDLDIENNDNSVAWHHRKLPGADIYFIANQKNEVNAISFPLPVKGMIPESWDPVTGEITKISEWKSLNGRTYIRLHFEANQSVFLVLRQKGEVPGRKLRSWDAPFVQEYVFGNQWQVNFDPKYGGPSAPVVMDELKSWPLHADSSIRYYSGTAVYHQTFNFSENDGNRKVWIQFDSIYNIATVKVNGKEMGTLWTRPYQLDITKAVKPGVNKLEIEVSNTWANRLIGDQRLPIDKRITWTTAPFRLGRKPLQPSGLVGKVVIFSK